MLSAIPQATGQASRPASRPASRQAARRATRQALRRATGPATRQATSRAARQAASRPARVALGAAAGLAAALAVALLLMAPPTIADTRWLDDRLITPDLSEMEHVHLDVVEDNSAWFALIADDDQGDHADWFTSTDAGSTWTYLAGHVWSDPSTVIGGAYGFGILMEVYEVDFELRYRTLDAVTGAEISSGVIAETDYHTAYEIIVDSNAETAPGGVEDFVVGVTMYEFTSLTARIKTYHTEDRGQTWTETATIDTGPAGHATYFYDMDMTFAVDGYPYFHIAYEKDSAIWHTYSMDGGRTWNPTAVTPLQSTHGVPQVGLGVYGTYLVIAASDTNGDLYACHSLDAGNVWGPTTVLATGLPQQRMVTIAQQPFRVFYRTADERIAMRSTLTPQYPSTWSDEEPVSVGATDMAFAAATCGEVHGQTGVVYLREDDDCRAYFVSAWGEPSSVDGDPGGSPWGDRHGDGPAWGHAPLTVFPSPSPGPVTILLGESPAANGSPSGLAAACSGLVTDAAGRVIARLGPAAARERALTWDARNLAGDPVANGTYYLRVAEPGGHTARSAPVIILR